MFTEIAEKSGILSNEMLDIMGVLFLMAAFGKSAQLPFIPWLSSPEDVDIDAMQGPTTVSALIHAATMVKAGVYLVSRLFLLLPLWDSNLFLWILVLRLVRMSHQCTQLFLQSLTIYRVIRLSQQGEKVPFEKS